MYQNCPNIIAIVNYLKLMRTSFEQKINLAFNNFRIHQKYPLVHLSSIYNIELSNCKCKKHGVAWTVPNS